MVERIAQQVHRHMTHVDPDDLKQSGFVGLCEAADRYTAEKGIFAAFAYFRVRGAMFDAHKRGAYRDETHVSISAIEERDGYLPRKIAEDRKLPAPDSLAERREQARLLSAAVSGLDPDERAVFLASLQGIALIQTAKEMGRSIAWARARLASARSQLGAVVHMWGLGLDKAA